MGKVWATQESVDADDLNLMVCPIGAVLPFAGSSAPSNWLLCDGSAVSRTTYADLFTLISTTYGTGDGSTTFNLPNLKGKVPVGKSVSDTEFDTLGETGGEKTHTLITSEIPAHTHDVTGYSGGAGANLSANANTGTVTSTSTSVGGGGAHNNLQPYIVLNYIIRY